MFYSYNTFLTLCVSVVNDLWLPLVLELIMPDLDDSSVVIGVDIGGTKMIAGLVTRSGEILATQQITTPSTPTAILEAVQILCTSLMESEYDVQAIGIGTAGMVDTENGQVIYANENLPGWTGTRLADIPIGHELPIVVENDVRAMAYCEAVLGAGRDHDHVLCVTVGTGIGGGIVLHQRLWHGATYSAGEIGYMVVGWDDDQPIQLDQFVSGPAIEREYQARSQDDVLIPLTEIAERATKGDEIATHVIQEKASQFGAILGGYTTSINPQVVVIGGGVPQIGALWWDAMKTAFYQAVPTPVKATQLMLSSLGISAVMLGAAMLAWQKR